MLLKALEQIFEANIAVINAILQYDYLWKKIQLTEGGKKNLEIFIHECSKRYNITAQETSEIQEIISLMEMHKKSPIEFQRKEKVVIVSDDLKTSNLDSEKLKKYLNSTKAIIEKARICMSLKRI